MVSVIIYFFREGIIVGEGIFSRVALQATKEHAQRFGDN
jgi:hypothetical protein